MRWEKRLAIALGAVVVSVWASVWCILRLRRYPQDPQHTLYGIATGGALIALFVFAVYTLAVILEKKR